MADKETLTRWKVNYIRHNLTSYDDELLSLYGRTGKDKAYLKLFGEVMNRIAVRVGRNQPLRVGEKQPISVG
jgi:hypothetical protein